MSRRPFAYPSSTSAHGQSYPPDDRYQHTQHHDSSHSHHQHPGPSGDPFYPPTPITSSQVFAFRPPPYPSHQPYQPPSHATSASTSRTTSVPSRCNTSHSQPYYRAPTSASHAPSRDLDDAGEEEMSSAEDETLGEKQKLEVKREKNRLKQRNLRIRRANHVSTLESSLETLEQKHRLLEDQHAEVRRREAGLERYVASLEEALRRNGLEGEVAQARGVWDHAGGQVRPLPAQDDLSDGRQGPGRGKKRRKAEEEGERVADGRRDGYDPANGSGLAYRLGRNHPDSYSSFVVPSPAQAEPEEPVRPRTSTSSFAPLVLDSSHSSHLISAPSPRSIRIEDLLSPSFTQTDTPSFPLSAYTIDTPNHLAATPSYNPDTASIISRRPSLAPGGVAMSARGSSDSMGSRAGKDSGAVSSAGEASLTISSNCPSIRTMPLFLPGPPPVHTVSTPPLHPSIHTARVLLRMLLADQANIPISHCVLPPLIPSQQTILLNAIYNLTTPAFRDKVNQDQILNMPAVLTKLLLGYSHSSTADLRIVLMPIAILRARVVGFLKEGLDFDVTAFITHVLADGRVFGDTADPNAWEMSETFWDVWGGWFKAGRKYCASMSGWRRRYGHKGANVIEILLGLEGEHSRMSELIGQPAGWKPPVVVAPDKEMVTPLR